jgi:hypothetical protein
MIFRAARALATDGRFQVAFMLLAVAVSVLIGVVTANAAYAAITLSVCSLVLAFCKHRLGKSLAR